MSFAIRNCQMSSQNSLIEILFSVNGYNNRKNDIIYCPPANRLSKNVIVYFGGDIQDFSDAMKNNIENKKYLKWSLNSIASLLLSSFSDSHIIVVRPCRIELNTFSCYDNFVKTPGKFGNPEHTNTHGALEHLQNLIQSVICNNEFSSDQQLPNVTQENSDDISKLNNEEPALRIQLIGFSKGCVVLNQFLYEFYYWSETGCDEKIKFMKCITDMYWLDGGHNGGRNIWITSGIILQTLINLGIQIHVHVSPYQVNDMRRKEIGIEEASFSKYLADNGAKIQRILHFGNESPSIDNHFKVITETFAPKISDTDLE